MKTYKYLYQQMLDENNIRIAYKNLRKGKTRRTEIKYIDAKLDEEIRRMKTMIENTKPCEVEHPELGYKPIHHEPKIINEHGKERKIYMPEIREQWLHHIIILILKPIIMRTAHPNVCGSYPGRGPHYGKRRIERWLLYRRHTRYYAKLDIRHFYNNISHKVLFRELESRIKDDWFLHIIKLCLAQFKKGLPLGFYISQWLANYLLEPLDHMVGKSFEKYMRYMDDIVIFDSSIKQLKQMVNKIGMMLGNRFYLRLKGNYQVTKFDYRGIGRPLDYMGFVFYRSKTIMRKHIMLRASRLSKKIYKAQQKGYRVYRTWISGLLSYIGWFSHTDSYNCYVKYIKPYAKIGCLKKLISVMDRRTRNDRMERNQILREPRYNYKHWSGIVYAN